MGNQDLGEGEVDLDPLMVTAPGEKQRFPRGDDDRAGVLSGPLGLLGLLWGLQCLHWSRHFPPNLPANI